MTLGGPVQLPATAAQSTLNVSVLGVSGTRATYLVTVSNSLPPPKGTVQVLYTFTTGGRKYYLEYDRYPGDADQTALFDAMVTGGLRFSACTPGTQPLPGLCVGRPATVQEEAAMIAVGRPAIEAAFGLQDWSTCSGKAACFRVGDPSRAMVGTNAGTFYGQEGQGPGAGCSSPCLGSGSWAFLYLDQAAWHFFDVVCTQDSDYLPSPGAHVFVTGCANVRDAPGLSSHVVACLANGTVVEVDSAPTYVDGRIWWHLAGKGWIAHDYLVDPALTGHS